MSIKNILIQYTEKFNSDNYDKIGTNYYFYLSAYHYYLRDCLRTLSIWNSISSSSEKILNSIVFQIDSYMKSNLLNYIIQHEFSILNTNGYLCGETDTEKELNYIFDISNSKDWVIYLFEKYPLIENLISTYTNNTINYLIQIGTDYVREKDILKHEFNIQYPNVIDIKLFMGDFHNKGRFVTKFLFDDNSSLMYKPRLAKNEAIFNSLIKHINNSGLDVQIKIPSYLEMNEHTWFEFIHPQLVQDDFDPHSYFKNMGKILCVLYAVGASDINAENLICSGGIPVIIDLECISKIFVKNTSISLFENYFNRSVISIGILPVWKYSNLKERNLLSSALFKYGSNIHLPQTSNKVFELSGDTLQDFLSGFNESYLALLHINLDVFLSNFKKYKQRVVIHDTILYSFFQREMRLPEYLHGGKSIVNIIERSIPKSYLKYSVKLCQSIVEQLQNNDIPSFYISPKETIVDGYGNSILSLSNVIKEERTLSETDLIFQRRVVETSIKQVLELTHPVNTGASHSNYIIQEHSLAENCLFAANKVSNEIFNSCLRIGDEVNWVGKNPSKLDGRFQADIMDESLYSGTAGIAILFGQLAQIENNEQYFNIYNTILNNLKDCFYRIEKYSDNDRVYSDMQVLSYHFFPICCIALICCNCHKDDIDEKWIMDILNFVRKGYLPHVRDCGYLGGITGYIDCLIELQRNNLVEIPHNYIEDAYDRLLKLEQSDKNFSVFPHYESISGKSSVIPLGGFAHGSSGIAYVLYKLFKLSNDKNIYKKFIRVLSHDRSFYAQSTNSWTDGRSQGSHQDMGAWCHGAGGIALSRVLLIKEGYYDDILSQELKIAVSVLKKHLGQNQCVCHGDLGNLEILKMIANTLNDKELSLYVDSQISNLAAKVIAGEEIVFGDGHTLPTMGLFLGKSGVAYQMLRFSNWENVPSLLFSNYKSQLS